ncbi:MAG TPA: methylated-DNA--[protein]-cysteine S-methyltransferase [Acidobacteriota bacterium]|nr:methylated-DNA--[protein]-cysteine S-methyltransferase [Acidobacteriota bacterium]
MSADYRRIQEAIRYLRFHAYDQPQLDDVAGHVGLSKFHFQRLFRRWAGVSPKRFLQFVTVQHAKRVLRESASVLEASFETGLSGPSRLHDLFVSAEAVTPGEYKSGGAGLELRYGLHDSTFGEFLIAASDRGIAALAFIDDRGSDAAVDDLAADWYAAALLRDDAGTAMAAHLAFAFDRHDAPLRLLLRGTNFQIQVWRALLEIPQGSAVSYGDVATAIGRPGAHRAVASAVGNNRIARLIPCHRVLRASGDFGDYRWDPVRKVAMLAWEAAHLRAAVHA